MKEKQKYEINQMESIGLQGHLHLVRIVGGQCPVCMHIV